MGGISLTVKTANKRKAQLYSQKELERHNREIEKQIVVGSGMIVQFAQKFESLLDKARSLVGDILSSIAHAGVQVTKTGNALYLFYN